MKVFCPLFFKKVGGVKGRQPLSRILKGGSPLTDCFQTKFADANFDLNFDAFKGVALKNPTRGVAP